MLYGLDLFSGIGGLTLALSEWVKPVAYCEIEPYAQKVLLSRMSDGQLPIAPIWDDVRTLQKSDIKEPVDIIYGGFPCQDISVAGQQAGITKETRSGLFYEIMRLTDELKPSFLFLENVPNIRNRGLDKVLQEITDRGFNCRWGILSASEVGAWHQRKRWWLLAYTKSIGCRRWQNTDEIGKRELQELSSKEQPMVWCETERCSRDGSRKISDSESDRIQRLWSSGEQKPYSYVHEELPMCESQKLRATYWKTEPNLGRVVDGLPNRVEQIKSLGNSVVPECAKEAFKRLIKF